MTDSPLGGSLQCPTCGATQPPAEACRRCKCDLSLLLATLDQRRRWKEAALHHMRDGRYVEAAEAARQCWSVLPEQDAARLMAIAHLLAGQFAAALDVQGSGFRT